MTAQKVFLPQAAINASQQSPHLSDANLDAEYEENVQALKKLLEGKTPPAQTIQNLLDATRSLRLKYLQRPDISIQQIVELYPVFKNPKWVSFRLPFASNRLIINLDFLMHK